MDSYPVSNQVRLPPAPLAQGRSVFARPPANRVLSRTQVRALVAGLGRSKPYTTVVSELGGLIQSYGEDARLFLLRILLREVDFLQLAAKDQLKVQLLSEELPKLLERPNFVSLVCRIFGPEHSSASFLSHCERPSVRGVWRAERTKSRIQQSSARVFFSPSIKMRRVFVCNNSMCM